jgi:putative spermidine/putrescine transport system ATP-binding protein
MLELQNVSKYYGAMPAVVDVSFTVADGEFLTLLGPSGSGKSTVLGMIAGYLGSDEGSIILDGRDLRRVSAADRGIGVVFQHYALFPHMTVAQNIAYGLKRRRWKKDRMKQRTGEMIALVGLEGLGDRRPSQLSGGQQQRVALARALAFEPALLLMDEPLGALDQEIRLQMQEEIRRIHRELRPSVVYVTHDKNEAFALSDRIGIMRSAELVAIDTPTALYGAPTTAFVAGFFGGHQLLDVDLLDVDTQGIARLRVDGQEVGIPLREIVPNGRALRLSVPVDTVSLSGEPENSPLTFAGQVHDIVQMGATTQVHCTTQPGGQRIVAQIKSHQAREWRVGDTVHLAIQVDGARLVVQDVTGQTKSSLPKEP